MVKGRKNLQRKKGEELFSLCPLEWLVKAIVTCEQSLSAISSLDLGGGGGGGGGGGKFVASVPPPPGKFGDSVPPSPPRKPTIAEEKSRESACLVDLIS